MWKKGLSLLLIVMVFSTTAAVRCGFKYTKAKLEKQCEIDLGEDRITDVESYGSESFLCVINENEIRLISSQGKVLNSHSFDEKITLVDADCYGSNNILVVLGGKTAVIFTFDEEQNKLNKKAEFSCDKTIISVSASYDFAYIVLENGDLFGLDVRNLGNDAVPGDEVRADLKLMHQNVRLVGKRGFVLNDNSYICMDQFTLTTHYDSFDEEIIGVANVNSCFQIVTSSAIYEPVIPTEIKKLQSFDNGQVYTTNGGYFYVKNDKFYYTGYLKSKEHHSPYAPEAKRSRVDIPEGYRYCSIVDGIVCYDDHKLICYSVNE